MPKTSTNKPRVSKIAGETERQKQTKKIKKKKIPQMSADKAKINSGSAEGAEEGFSFDL